MGRHRSPYFFKILLDPSAPHLPLPPDFVSKNLEDKIPKHILIRSANGGYSWRLKIKKIGESFCLSDGWDIVVRDIQLGFGDFLVFRFLDKSVLKMVVFSPNGCEKDFPPKTQVDNDSDVVDVVDVDEDLAVADDDLVVDDDEAIEQEEADVEEEDEVEDDDEDEDEDDDDDDDDEEEEEEEEEEEYVDEKDDGDDEEDDGEDDGVGDIDGDEGDPFFMLVISKTHKSMMWLPVAFAELAGIDREGTVTVANLEGKEWQLRVRVDKGNPKRERYCLSAGWHEFRRLNGLSDGDECVFKFIRSEEKLLLARVTKNKRSLRQPQTNPSVKTPVKEAVKRLREQPRRNSGKVPAIIGEKGQATHGDVDVGKNDKGGKRSRGRPARRRRGKTARRK